MMTSTVHPVTPGFRAKAGSGSSQSGYSKSGSSKSGPSKSGPAACATWLLAALATLGSCGGGDSTGLGGNAATEPDIYTVRRADMLVAVQEQGEIQALEQTQVRSGVEGRATIIYLVPEGSRVEKGQKIVELDASELEDRAANQAITVERANATLVDAQQNVEILEKELQALAATAASRLEVAEIAVEKYLGRQHTGAGALGERRILDDSLDTVDATADALPSGPKSSEVGSSDSGSTTLSSAAGGSERGGSERGGSGRGGDEPAGGGTNREMLVALRKLVASTDYASLPGAVIDLLGEANLDRDLGEMANQVLEQIDQIRLARSDLKLKGDTLEHSKRLAAKDYITRNELDGDQLDFDSQQSRVRLAWNQLDLLVHYGLRSEKIGLELEVDNARLELSKVKASALARRAREAAELRSRESEYKLAKERLDNLQTQIKNAVIFAPNPGLVVYAKVGDGRRSTEVVEEGIEVRERQTLIVLPDVSKMIAELKVSEADIDKVVVGQVASLRIDAFPDRDFPGRVSRVSPLPDSGSRWSNNNKKVYKTSVELDGVNELLRPGMSSTVTIEVGRMRDVLSVPLQAVDRDRAIHYIWKRTASGPVATIVQPGQVNLTHVELNTGVDVGDEVYLSKPPGIEAPTFEQPERASEGDTTPPDPAEVRKQRQASAEQGGRRPGGASAARSGGGGGKFWANVKKKLPQFADQIDESSPWSAFSNKELMAAIKADPELNEAMQAMRSKFGGGGGGGRPDSKR